MESQILIRSRNYHKIILGFPDDYQSMDNYTVQLAAFF